MAAHSLAAVDGALPLGRRPLAHPEATTLRSLFLRFSSLRRGTLLTESKPDSSAAFGDLEVTVPGMETPAETLDAIGLLCPEPLFQARTAIDALEPGDVLEVLADDPAAEEDLTRFAKRAGHEMVEVEDEGAYKRFLIRRGT